MTINYKFWNKHLDLLIAWDDENKHFKLLGVQSWKFSVISTLILLEI